MGIFSKHYIKNFVGRYNKVVGIPYYSYQDFENLKQETYSFVNSDGIDISYFFYYYDNYKKDQIIVFCHGLGPGHTAYMAEINELAKAGYRVLTLDYRGCDKSGGDYIKSLNKPTRDVMDLLDYLKLKEKITLVGHSLGGYTALNVINLRKDINKAVILSGFIEISSLLMKFVPNKFILNRVLHFEKKIEPKYYGIDNISYLKTTKDEILYIQSIDDQMVPYDIGLQVVESIDNPNIKTIKETNKKHNPNYSESAIQYMDKVFGEYNRLLKEKKIKTDSDRIEYFKDVSLSRLVKQDPVIIKAIVDFIG